ncbi:hypothetical protein G9A89_019650 [Geosiphon pyriformis]|nr:hypothetical protein G9A89_019650 [Geosiphon pyriformis]
MAYALITKLDNFTGEENNTQIWLNDIEKAISLATKPQTLNEFKTEFLRYFSNNNSINCLTNTFTTIKQGDTEAVTTYLGCFHRNLCQIQAIQADYFTVPQILNQFIRGLHSSILQRICPMHPVNFPTAVTYARDFEAAELKANHTQAVNLAMNRSSELDSKLKQFTIYQAQLQVIYQPQPPAIYQTPTIQTLPANPAQMTSGNPRLRITQNWRLAIVVHQPIFSSSHQQSESCQQNSGTGFTQNPNSQHYLSLLVTPEDTTSSNLRIKQQQPPTNNISSATITENESLDAIFLFELKKPSNTPLFSEAVLKKKLITAMYTDAKIDDHFIKLILDSGLAGSIIT